MHTTGSRPKLVVSADGHGVVSHAGSRLLADLTEATGLTGFFTNALHRLRPRGTGHDPGRLAIDLAVMLADGGEAIADLALLCDQRQVFGPVASTPTAWRVLADIDTTTLAALRTAPPPPGKSPGCRPPRPRAGHRSPARADATCPAWSWTSTPPSSPATPRSSACGDINRGSLALLSDDVTGRCVNGDGSFNGFSRVKSEGAKAVGGSGQVSLQQQNVAQRGRQNSACANSDFAVTANGGRQDSVCENKDASHNKHTLTKGGGARTEGGSSIADVFQQNTAQEGRQNNNCANPNNSGVELTDSDIETRCLTVDESKRAFRQVRPHMRLSPLSCSESFYPVGIE
ncbi:transposase [Streptomyces sp. NPDC051636]|uniref:transposase n=1 Tax=Streptomyces sp. NPDC051636 TaxID=3365663 RepID=UPI0037B968A4